MLEFCVRQFVDTNSNFLSLKLATLAYHRNHLPQIIHGDIVRQNKNFIKYYETYCRSEGDGGTNRFQRKEDGRVHKKCKEAFAQDRASCRLCPHVVVVVGLVWVNDPRGYVVEPLMPVYAAHGRWRFASRMRLFTRRACVSKPGTA